MISPGKKLDPPGRLFLRYALNNLFILSLPLLVAIIYFGVSSQALGTLIDEFAQVQLTQSIEGIDREFGELQQMVARLSEDYEVNLYLSSDGNFSDLEYYNLRSLADKFVPTVVGSPIVSHILLYLHRSEVLISESGFGYYPEYYGTVLSFAGYNAAQWRDTFLLAPSTPTLMPSRILQNRGNLSSVRLYRANIGFGDYYLGSLVGVISEEGLRSMIADMPAVYGGWVEVADSRGNLVVATAPPGGRKPDLRLVDPEARSIEFNGQKYRLYRRSSGSLGWTYTAAVNETLVLAQLTRMQYTALGLLSLGLVLGLSAAYFFAFRTSKPWGRVFELATQSGDSLFEAGKPGGAFHELERAIDILATRSQRMQEEVRAAEKLTQLYFLQNALRGTYGSKEDFDREQEEYRVKFLPGLYYIVLVRIIPFNAVRGQESYKVFLDALQKALEQARDPGDFLVPMSFDDIVLVRSLSSNDPRADGIQLIERVQEALAPGLRGDFSFGVGGPVAEPYLLTLSYHQGVSAITSVDAHHLVRFYQDVSPSELFYSYPLDLEENLTRAIKSGNKDLVTTILESVRKENFVQRRLSEGESEDFFVEIKGTLLKAMKVLPEGNQWPEEDFARWWSLPSNSEKFDRFGILCSDVTRLFSSHKKSHNSVLLKAIQEFLAEKFADPGLSMTSLAEEFNRSENYLSSFYKEQTGVRLTDALLEIRMTHANQLLSRGFDSIDEIGLSCGYTTPQTFRRAFKRHFGMAPSDYRTRTSS